jgi:cytochrome c oxidase subunit 3
MAVDLHPPIATQPRPNSGGRGDNVTPPVTRGWGGGDSGGNGYHAEQRYKLAVWVGLAGVVMLFAAISSAMIVRSAGEDWLHVELPAVLWVSTGLLLISSLVFEMAKRSARHQGPRSMRIWVALTALLGIAFVAAQVEGWSQLLAQGVVVKGHPSGAFFYLLTAAHGLHVLGGLCVLVYVVIRTSLSNPWLHAKAVVEASALYWHAMGALWLYVLGLLLYLG